MPQRTGRGTYKGYESPVTTGWPDPIRDEVRRVYGAWRSKHPGEHPKIKARGARIAWYVAKKKYPTLYRQHIKVIRATRQEMKEHPWAGKKTAERIAEDHISHSRRSPKGRSHRIADLHAAARQQRGYARTAHHESVSERKRAKALRKAGRSIQARDLEQDAKLAASFEKWRLKKADKYDMEAERIAKVTGA